MAPGTSVTRSGLRLETAREREVTAVPQARVNPHLRARDPSYPASKTFMHWVGPNDGAHVVRAPLPPAAKTQAEKIAIGRGKG
jgi:hypothetical protein